jgi:hypothetical protein
MKSRRYNRPFLRVYQWKVGEHKERVNEGEYGGGVLYSYMKIKE